MQRRSGVILRLGFARFSLSQIKLGSLIRGSLGNDEADAFNCVLGLFLQHALIMAHFKV